MPTSSWHLYCRFCNKYYRLSFILQEDHNFEHLFLCYCNRQETQSSKYLRSPTNIPEIW